jgi:hypothetical protein
MKTLNGENTLLQSLVCSFIILSCLMLSPKASYAAEDDSRMENISAGAVAVLPFVKGDITEQFRSKNASPLVCPINQICIDLSEGDETLLFMERLDADLDKVLRKRLGPSLLSHEATVRKYKQITIDPIKDTPLTRALILARKIQGDYVLVPILWNYSERVGNQYAVTEPASVAFSLYLVSAKLEKKVWEESFDKTQQSLTDNILNVKDMFQFGGKWVTAEELSQVGIHNIIEDFPLGTTGK